MTSLRDQSNVECACSDSAASSEAPKSERHRVELTFQPGFGMSAKLICPESGCSPPGTCAQCGRDLHDDEAEPCYDCRDAASWDPECWLKTWFDNLTADELLSGKIIVAIDGEWDGDQAVAHIVEVPR